MSATEALLPGALSNTWVLKIRTFWDATAAFAIFRASSAVTSDQSMPTCVLRKSEMKAFAIATDIASNIPWNIVRPVWVIFAATT